MYDPLIRLLLLAHLASSFYMIGLIWFVQMVHYPLFANVGIPDFPSYEQRHTALTTWVVAPPMLIEGATAILLIWFRPAEVAPWALWTGLALLGVIWLSTAVIQVPCHEVLSKGFDAVVHQRLVSTNWLRTGAWSLRGVLVLWMVWNSLALSEGKSKMAKLEVGDAAPAFSATTYDGKSVSLSDYLGKHGVVIFFYPKDGTSICTKEACAFRDSYEKFTEAGVEVIGVSSDTDETHRAFAGQNKLTFPLISDSDGSLRKAFAVPNTFGLIPGRVTYVIDKAGIVRLFFSAQLASDEHVRQALMAVEQAKRD
jgi:peroxiredoxin Q/BCP